MVPICNVISTTIHFVTQSKSATATKATRDQLAKENYSKENQKDESDSANTTTYSTADGKSKYQKDDKSRYYPYYNIIHYSIIYI